MSLLGIFGERQQNTEVRTNNGIITFNQVTAVLSIANILKSSLGPQGLDKLIVNDVGDIVITNDGATILNQLEVEHPAAKILVELAQIQDREVIDN